jgi:hypothetical protein
MPKRLSGNGGTDIKLTETQSPQYRTVTSEQANLAIIGKCALERSKRSIMFFFFIFVLKFLIPNSRTDKNHSKKSFTNLKLIVQYKFHRDILK